MLLVMLVALPPLAILEVMYLSNHNSCHMLPGLPDPSTAISCYSLVSFFPYAKGFQSYRRDYFVITKRCPGKSYPYFLLSL